MRAIRRPSRRQGCRVRAGDLCGIGIALGALALAGGCAQVPWNPPETSGALTGRTLVKAGYYRVNVGDTVDSIAAAFGQRPVDIAAWNRLAPGAAAMPGKILRVAPPAGTAPAASVSPPPGEGRTAAPDTVESMVPLPAPLPQALPQMPAAAPVALAWPLHGPAARPDLTRPDKGISIAGLPGEAVRAAAPGLVVYAGTGMPAYGPLVVIRHAGGVVTAYGHNSQLFVKEGDTVTRSQPVALPASDVHGVPSVLFDVRWQGRPVDPLAWLPRPHD